MESKKFTGYNCDLVELQESIETYFVGREFRVTNFHKDSAYLTQVYRNDLGNKAIFVKIEGLPVDFTISIGFGKRVKSIQNFAHKLDGIPFQVELLLGNPMLERNFWNYIKTQVELNRNSQGLTKTFFSQLPHVWREREILREIEVVYCSYCGTKNNARLVSCTNCGGRLR